MINLSKKIASESGMILMASTMGIFILLSIFAFYLARFSVLETRSGAYHIQDIKARNIAMTGVEHGWQVYKSTKSTINITKDFNQGSYTVSFDSDNDEANTSLDHSKQYLTMKVSGTIDDVERNIRFLLSSIPEAFCFSFYGNNEGSVEFSTAGAITGDMFFKGNIDSYGGTNNGITYTSTGDDGTTVLTFYPEFPQIVETYYNDLIDDAQASSYTNYALNFDGMDDYISISNSNDINTGNGHTAKTIEAWFKVDNVDLTEKQTIYEQGGTVRGLNIYIYNGLLYVGGWNEPGGSESGWNGTWLFTAADEIESDKWHHVALTLNGDDDITTDALRGYLDGVEFDTSPGSGSELWHHPGDVCIGRNGSTKFDNSGDTNTPKYFSGAIDEVRLWNTVRNQEQIEQNKDKILSDTDLNGQATTDLIAYYDFQEDNAEDKKGNHNGTVQNDPEWQANGPILSGMSSPSFIDDPITLTGADNQILVNGNLEISNTTVTGSGEIVATGSVTIIGTTINGNIVFVCGGDLTITNSTFNSGNESTDAVIIYSKGSSSYTSSTIRGLIVSKGSSNNQSLDLSGATVHGAILNYTPTFNLTANSEVNGSVVSYYSVNLEENCSITRQDIPEFAFAGVNLGLSPFIVPGSYLEY